jgi:hypothetical protein
MFRFASFACGALGALALILPVAAADSPWNGTWKLNPAKSKLTGYTFSYKSLPGGKFLYTNGAQFAVTFACDGKPYPMIGTDTVVCTTPSAREYDYTFAAAGKPVMMAVWKLSPDGNDIAETEKHLHADGTASTESSTYKRLGEGTGLVGTWEETRKKITAPRAFTYKAFDGGVDIAYPAYKQTIHLTFDGKPSDIEGPGIKPGSSTVTAVSAGPLSYMETDKVGSKVTFLAKTTVSGDGKTMTSVTWDPGKQSEASTYVYEKQ